MFQNQGGTWILCIGGFYKVCQTRGLKPRGDVYKASKMNHRAILPVKVTLKSNEFFVDPASIGYTETCQNDRETVSVAPVFLYWLFRHSCRLKCHKVAVLVAHWIEGHSGLSWFSVKNCASGLGSERTKVNENCRYWNSAWTKKKNDRILRKCEYNPLYNA